MSLTRPGGTAVLRTRCSGAAGLCPLPAGGVPCQSGMTVGLRLASTVFCPPAYACGISSTIMMASEAIFRRHAPAQENIASLGVESKCRLERRLRRGRAGVNGVGAGNAHHGIAFRVVDGQAQ